ncbi:MAG: TetR/AcrR family transcriptional regulator [Leptospirales bacterium]
MARPIEFNKEAVLMNAMKVFWLKGYESTSMADLIEATGLTSRSMYNVFGSKNGFFKATLDKYYEGLIGPLAKLEHGEGAKAIRTYVETISAMEPLNGCLYVNTLSEKNSVEDDCVRKVMRHFERLESAFRSKLEYAKEHENFTAEPKLRAKQLVSMLQGLAVYSKINFSVEEQKEMAQDSLRMIGI